MQENNIIYAKVRVKCDKCNGTGIYYIRPISHEEFPCSKCRGKGEIIVSKPLSEVLHELHKNKYKK